MYNLQVELRMYTYIEYKRKVLRSNSCGWYAYVKIVNTFGNYT